MRHIIYVDYKFRDWDNRKTKPCQDIKKNYRIFFNINMSPKVELRSNSQGRTALTP